MPIDEDQVTVFGRHAVFGEYAFDAGFLLDLDLDFILLGMVGQILAQRGIEF